MKQVKTKFEKGDWVICNNARLPAPLRIRRIDYIKREYIINEETKKTARSVICFENENNWRFCKNEDYLTQIIKRIRKEIYETKR